MSWSAELVDDIMVPARALVVALGGVWLARFWFEGNEALAIGVPLIVFGLGQLAAGLGDRLLPRSPVTALKVLEFWVLAPGIIATGAAAVVVIVGVELTVTGSPETKALAAALGTGMTAFVTTSFLGWLGDTSDSKVANRIRKAFWAHYKRKGTSVPGTARVRYFAANSPGERWVYSHEYRGVEGWGRDARRARAQGLEKEIPNAEP